MSWISRWRNTFRPRRLDHDLADEISDHLARRTEDLERQGATHQEAERRAILAFGSINQVREQSRAVRLWPMIEGAAQDIRYAWRGMRRNPVFAMTAVVSLGLAIGANTAIFSIVNAVLLRPLPAAEPDQLFTLWAKDVESDTFSYPAFDELRTAAKGSARLALFDSPYRVEAQAFDPNAPRDEAIQQFVSPDAFDVLGVPPAMGRLFSVNEGTLPVAVLSYDYWRARFQSDPLVLGRTLFVSGRPYSIVGVARQEFSGVEAGKFVDIWMPVTQADPGILIQPEYRPFHLIGRLTAGVTREQITAQLQPAFHRHETLEARSGATGVSLFRRAFSRPLWIMLAVAACTLLIACANVASLLLARSTARAGEMAMRASLGASRGRLQRQMLTESLLLASLAGFGGYLLAGVIAPMLVALTSTQADPIRVDLSLDGRVLAFCIGLCGLSTFLFGVAPAWQATVDRPMSRLRGTARLGRWFVGVQVAFAFCLVTGGAGFVFSLRNLTSVDTGFDPRGVTVLTVANDLGPRQRELQLTLMRQLSARTALLPGVQSAATAWNPLLSGGRRAERVGVAGQPPSATEETFYRVSPGYLATLRTPLLDGRDFVSSDDDTEPISTIVNRKFIDRYHLALGREFQGAQGIRHRVIGVAANSLYGSLRNGTEAIAYIPMKPPRAFTLYVRSTLDPGTVGKLVEREAKTLGSGLHVRDMATLESLVGNTILKEKLLAGIGAAFAFLGLALAAVGLFGLLNYSVTRRTKEIGIRSTLGAARSSVVLLVIEESLGMILLGLGVGLAASLVLLRFSRALLYGVEPADPMVIGTAVAVFMAAALAAGSVPALRAASIDPAIALRHE